MGRGAADAGAAAAARVALAADDGAELGPLLDALVHPAVRRAGPRRLLGPRHLPAGHHLGRRRARLVRHCGQGPSTSDMFRRKEMMIFFLCVTPAGLSDADDARREFDADLSDGDRKDRVGLQSPVGHQAGPQHGHHGRHFYSISVD